MVPREGFFEHEGVRLRYLVWDAHCATGDDAASVVLVHGFAQRAESWDGVASLLADAGVGGVAIDLVGHGKSDRPDDEVAYAFAWQVRALAAVLREAPRLLDLPEGAPLPCLCGYSMGGRLAAGVAMAYPGSFDGLVLESAGLGPADETERAQLGQRNRQWAQRLRSEGVAAFMDWWETLPLFATQRSLPPGMRERIRAGRIANDAEALARTFEHAGAHAMPLASEAERALTQLARSGCAVTYCAGALDGKYRDVASRLFAASEGSVAVRVVDGAGHNVHLERPEEFARIVRTTAARL